MSLFSIARLCFPLISGLALTACAGPAGAESNGGEFVLGPTVVGCCSDVPAGEVVIEVEVSE
jgi:hypothetical protein